MRFAFAAALLFLTCASPQLAFAEPHPPSALDRASAASAFESGRRLFRAGKIHEACADFARSMALDPQPGTQINLAVCHAREKRLGTAWRELSDAKEQARRDRRQDRLSFLEKELAQIEDKVPRLAVDVSSDARVSGLVVKVDGEVLHENAYTVEIAMDPGPHTVVAEAPGYDAFRESLELAPNGERRRVAVGALTKKAPVQSVVAVPAPAPLPAPAPQPTPSGSSAEPRPAPAGAGLPEAVATEGPSYTLPVILGVVGVASVAAGAVFGVRSIDQRNDAEAACDRGDCATGRERDADATTSAWIANVGVGVGIVALGASALLLVLRTRAPTASVRRALPMLATRWEVVF